MAFCVFVIRLLWLGTEIHISSYAFFLFIFHMSAAGLIAR